MEGLTKVFQLRKQGFLAGKSEIRATDNVSFTINKGETLGIVGESGSGKTTAARSFLRLINPDSGTIQINGIDITTLNRRELRHLRRKVQFLFQDPYGSLNPRMTVSRIIGEPLRLHEKLSTAEREKKAAELLEKVGMDSSHGLRYPHEFSGGQRQRIAIARAIALSPDLLVLDEPVSALDVSIQGQILNLLKDLQDDMGMSYLFVSHDLSVVANFCDRVAVMYLGRIVEENSTSEIFSNPRHPYTRMLFNSLPRPERNSRIDIPRGEIPGPENPPQGCHFHPRCSEVMDICRSSYPEENRASGRVSCHLYD